VLSGSNVGILNFGALLGEAAFIAKQEGYSLCDMRWIKPLDTELITKECANMRLLVTLEDGCKAGGAGSAVIEWLAANNIHTPVLQLAIEDKFVEHASRGQQLTQNGLDATTIKAAIKARLSTLAAPNSAVTPPLTVNH